MIAKAAAAVLLLSFQVQAQTAQGTAYGVTSGPAAGTPTHMNSPQAGPLETQHQLDTVRDQSQSVRNRDNQTAPSKSNETGKNDETGTGSSSPRGGLAR